MNEVVVRERLETRTLDLGIISSDFKHKSIFIQSLGDEPFGRAPVFVRIFTYDLACGGTKSDTVKQAATQVVSQSF